MEQLFETFLNSITKYIKNPESIDLITKAYLFANDKHNKQTRVSGDPYIIHPLNVAIILSELEVGPNTLIAGLLHDVLEDTATTAEEITTNFNADITSMVQAVTKISNLTFSTINSSINQQKMLIAMARDVRVILIKVADRLHNMRTLGSLDENRRIRIAKETLEIHAPLANRLGIFKIKSELEDLALKYTMPIAYYDILDRINATKSVRDSSIKLIQNEIKVALEKNNIFKYEIKGRVKNIYSIYKKISGSNKTFDEIYDLLAIRIILERIDECYLVLGIIHSSFVPMPKRFKDYIAVPKANMYQSLHTTVLGSNEALFEVQIRTYEMDSVAELGVAAHWAYKENVVYSKEKEQFEIANQLKWYGELLKISEEESNENSVDFVDTVKGDILDSNVYVFTPKSEVIELPKNSTPIDFAYRIHTNIGHAIIGAIVNGRIVPLDYKLANGDIVNIKTNKNNSGPSEDWLKIVGSSFARHKIKAFLNQKNMNTIIAQAKTTIEKEIAANKITEPLTDEFAAKFFDKFNVKNLTDLYFEVGKGNISTKTVINKLGGIEVDEFQNLNKQMERTTKKLQSASSSGVIVEGLNKPQIKISKCCLPVPGDQIIGYISKSNGIIVHNVNCPNCNSLDENRKIDCFWEDSSSKRYPTKIRVISNNYPNALSEVVTSINSLSIPIAEIVTRKVNKLEVEFYIKLTVLTLSELDKAMLNINKSSHIFSVERLYS